MLALNNLQQLQDQLRTDIKGLPPRFDLLYQTEKSAESIMVKNEEDYVKMQKVSKESKVDLTIYEKLDSEGEYEIIGEEDDAGIIELKDEISEKV